MEDEENDGKWLGIRVAEGLWREAGWNLEEGWEKW